MIISEKLVWFHLPKTAGTTTDRLFTASRIPLSIQDSQSSYVKHLPLNLHPNRQNISIESKQPVVNFRRLPYWLLSNYHHKIKKMSLSLSFDPVKSGMFWRDKENTWLPADWWLDRFDIDDSWSFLRVEHLKADFLSCLNMYQPISLIPRARVNLVKSLNKTDYVRSLDHWFDCCDFAGLYDSNPRWAALEQKLYGSLILPPIK